MNWEDGSEAHWGFRDQQDWHGWVWEERDEFRESGFRSQASASTAITISCTVEGWEGRLWVRGMTGTGLCLKVISGNDCELWKDMKRGNSGHKKPGLARTKETLGRCESPRKSKLGPIQQESGELWIFIVQEESN